MSASSRPKPNDKYIPLYIVLFFVVFMSVDAFMVYKAVSTQTGVVTQNAYEKGLHYDHYLKQEAAQPDLDQKLVLENGILRWTARDEKGLVLEGADVKAIIKRPVQDGYDFAIVLKPMGGGIYESPLKTPLPGLWSVDLQATWDKKTYQTQQDIITP